MQILVVEDEKHLADGLRFNLEAEGYHVSIEENGRSGLEAAGETAFDAIVLDVMLPFMDGFSVVRAMRENGNYTPVLMLTARGRPEDVVEGFAAGADDYLPKPFDLDVFLARLNALLRRRDWIKNADNARTVDRIEIYDKTLDLANLEIITPDGRQPLTLMEAKLLRFLIENENSTVSRRTILEDVWELQEDTDTRAIDNFIVRLRKMIEKRPNDPEILLTVRGVGYRFVMPRADE